MSVPPCAGRLDGWTGWASLPARAHRLEPDPAEGVAADPAAIDTQGDPPYSDDVVSHDTLEDTFGRGGASFRNSGEGVPTGSLRDAPGKAARSPWSESARLAFLARAQYVDPRERRA